MKPFLFIKCAKWQGNKPWQILDQSFSSQHLSHRGRRRLLISHLHWHASFLQYSEDAFKAKEQDCVGCEVGGFYSKEHVSVQLYSVFLADGVRLPHFSKNPKLLVTFSISCLRLSCQAAWCCSPPLGHPADKNTPFELIFAAATSPLSLAGGKCLLFVQVA